jgi:hypothetical protein
MTRVRPLAPAALALVIPVATLTACNVGLASRGAQTASTSCCPDTTPASVSPGTTAATPDTTPSDTGPPQPPNPPFIDLGQQGCQYSNNFEYQKGLPGSWARC